MSETGKTRTAPVSTGIVLVVVLGFTVSLLGSSLKNTVQVFIVPMAASFGQPRGTFILATTVFAAVYAVAAPLVGLMADRIGPSRVLLSGTLLAGTALLLCSLSSSFQVFVVTYGVLASFAYTMLSYVPMGVLVDRIFPPNRRGFFYALLTNGTAAGFIFLVPLWTWLGHHTSWQRILVVLGLLLLVVIAPLTLLMGRQSRQKPDVKTERARTVPWRQTVRSPVLWRLAAAFFACGASMAFIDVSMIPYLSGMGMMSGTISVATALLGAFEIAGSLVAGRLCDSGPVKRVLVAGYLIRAVAMFLIAIRPDTFTTLVFGAVFGASYLVTVVGTSIWVLRALPAGSRGVAMGIIWTVHQIGAAIFTQLAGVIFDYESTYVPVIVATGSVALIAATIVITIPSPDGEPKRLHEPEPAEAL
jgi:predicted MFS family arabinose efflux permease